MGEEDWPDHGDIDQRAEVDVTQPRRLDPDVALPDQGREAEAEERERQARGDLIGQCHLG